MPIRDATIDDLPAIVEIYNSTVVTRVATADTEPVSIASRERWFSEHSSAHRPLWVAVNAGHIAGWLSYSSFYGRPAYDGTCEVSVYIALEDRRQGLATELLARCIQYAPRIGVMTLLGFVFGHNQPSLSLFEKLGFRHWGCLPRVAVLDGVERDLVIVGRRT